MKSHEKVGERNKKVLECVCCSYSKHNSWFKGQDCFWRSCYLCSYKKATVVILLCSDLFFFIRLCKWIDKDCRLLPMKPPPKCVFCFSAVFHACQWQTTPVVVQKYNFLSQKNQKDFFKKKSSGCLRDVINFLVSKSF